MKRFFMFFAVVLAGAVSAVAFVLTSQAAPTSPVAAAKAFLIDSTLDRNGFRACNYLTSAEQHTISVAGQGESCRQAIDTGTAQLQVGGLQVTSLGDVKKLKTSESVHGGHATVSLADGRSHVAYQLVKADAAEQQEFQAPTTHWRISAGPGLPSGKGASAPSSTKQV